MFDSNIFLRDHYYNIIIVSIRVCNPGIPNRNQLEFLPQKSDLLTLKYLETNDTLCNQAKYKKILDENNLFDSPVTKDIVKLIEELVHRLLPSPVYKND